MGPRSLTLPLETKREVWMQGAWQSRNEPRKEGSIWWTSIIDSSFVFIGCWEMVRGLMGISPAGDAVPIVFQHLTNHSDTDGLKVSKFCALIQCHDLGWSQLSSSCAGCRRSLL